MSCEARQPPRGFTLIEVLVALTIIAFGLIAVFGQLSQSASAATRLRDKTLAHWVAMNTLTEMRLRGDFPAVGTQSDDVEMANTRWRYEIKTSETASEYLRRADITVAFEDKPDRPLATAIGFLGRQTTSQTQGPAVTRSGWPLLSPDGTPAEEDELPAEARQKPAPGATPEKTTDGAAR